MNTVEQCDHKNSHTRFTRDLREITYCPDCRRVVLNDVTIEYTAPPTIAKFMKSDAPLRILVGPTASGKTTGCFMEILRRCKEAPARSDGKRRSKWAIISGTRSLINCAVIPPWLDWLGGLGTFNRKQSLFTLEFSDIHADIFFIGLNVEDDVINLLNMELTGAFVLGVQPFPIELLQDITARVGRYPRYDGVYQWSGIICESLRPDEGTPRYALCHNEPQADGTVIPAEVFWQPSGLSPESENKDNLPPDYYKNLSDRQSTKWVRKYVECMYY